MRLDAGLLIASEWSPSSDWLGNKERRCVSSVAVNDIRIACCLCSLAFGVAGSLNLTLLITDDHRLWIRLGSGGVSAASMISCTC